MHHTSASCLCNTKSKIMNGGLFSLGILQSFPVQWRSVTDMDYATCQHISFTLLMALALSHDALFLISSPSPSVPHLLAISVPSRRQASHLRPWCTQAIYSKIRYFGGWFTSLFSKQPHLPGALFQQY